jgi:hypothetical protein
VGVTCSSTSVIVAPAAAISTLPSSMSNWCSTPFGAWKLAWTTDSIAGPGHTA